MGNFDQFRQKLGECFGEVNWCAAVISGVIGCAANVVWPGAGLGAAALAIIGGMAVLRQIARQVVIRFVGAGVGRNLLLQLCP